MSNVNVCSCGEKYWSEQGRIDCEKSHVRGKRNTDAQILAAFKLEAERANERALAAESKLDGLSGDLALMRAKLRCPTCATPFKEVERGYEALCMCATAECQSRLDACQSSRVWLQEQNTIEQKAAAELQARLDKAEQDGEAGRKYAEGVAEASMEKWAQAEERAKDLSLRLDAAVQALTKIRDGAAIAPVAPRVVAADALEYLAVEMRVSIDYRVLLEKYVRRVKVAEGTDCIDVAMGFPPGQELTNDEVLELEAISSRVLEIGAPKKQSTMASDIAAMIEDPGRGKQRL